VWIDGKAKPTIAVSQPQAAINANPRPPSSTWAGAPARHGICSISADTQAATQACFEPGHECVKACEAETVTGMKHSSTRDLYAYWDAQRGTRLAPERSDIDPGAIRHVLGDSFIIAEDPRADHPIRLAGTRLCALYGRELKGEAFVGIWSPASRPLIRELIAIAAEESVGLVAGAIGTAADGVQIELELLLLPLKHRRRTHLRLIGVLTPLAVPCWLGTVPLTELTLGPLRHVGPAVETVAAPRLMAGGRGGRMRHGLMIYDGGRANTHFPVE
jgi:hypothetical protein